MARRLTSLIKEFVERMESQDYVFIGAIAVTAHGVGGRTLDLDVISKNEGSFEAANLSLRGMGFEEARPSERFAPNFAKWEKQEFGADVMLKELWLQAEVGDEKVEQRITPDGDFWDDIELKGREIFGVDIPVPKPLDLVVFKAVSSVSPVRNFRKAKTDREHAMNMIHKYPDISPNKLRKRGRAMTCLPEVEEFIEKTLRDVGES